MQRVLVLDKNKNPLMPCHSARARQLLKQGKAAVFRQYPFTINPSQAPLQIRATGHQSRQICRVDKYGFPRTSAKQGRVHFGFQTGDMVKALVKKGVKRGMYVGRVSVRASGSFNITTPTGTTQGISYRYCNPIHKSDGYFHEKGEALSSATTRVAVSPRQAQ